MLNCQHIFQPQKQHSFARSYTPFSTVVHPRSFAMSDSTQIQTALFALLDVFRSAASSGDSDHSTLNRIELRVLIQSQLPFLMHENFDEQFEAFFKCVEDKSGSNVDFKEFMCLLATIVMCSKNRP